MLPLHALPAVPARVALPAHLAAAAVRGTPELAAGARTLVEGMATLRAALVPWTSPSRLAELTHIHANFRADTDEFDAAASGLSAAEAAADALAPALALPRELASARELDRSRALASVTARARERFRGLVRVLASARERLPPDLSAPSGRMIGIRPWT